MTAHRLLSPRWLTTGGAIVLAGVVGIALLLNHGDPACAAAAGSKATFYDLNGGTGNCSFPSAPADDLFVALGEADYDGGAACGGYLDVTGPKGKVRVKVIDSCPPCEAGHIDLSRTAFKKIANEIDGIVPVTFKKVKSPKVPGPISVRLKEGSSQYWFAALIDNHANPLTSVNVSSGGGGFKSAQRTDFNYWIIDGGAGSGPFTIKITDGSGTTKTLSGIKLKPGVTQKTSVRVTGSGGATVAAPKPKKKPAAKPSPSASAPSPSVSSAAPVLESGALPSEPAPVVAPALAAKSCG